MKNDITIRPAAEHEVPSSCSSFANLAQYEHLEHEVVATEQTLREALFRPQPYAEVVFACLNGEPVGFALFFHNFSTFLGRPGIYLEICSCSRKRGAMVSDAGCSAGWPPSRWHEVAPPRMGGSRLESAFHRLLPQSGRGPDGRMADIPPDGRGAHEARGAP